SGPFVRACTAIAHIIGLPERCRIWIGGVALGAFKRCDYCGRTVNWNDVQERRTWLELHWDVLDEGHPEQVWDFCCWDCAVNFGLSRRKGPVGDLVRELGDRVMAAGAVEDEYIT